MKTLIALGLFLSSSCTAYATPEGDGRFTKDPPKVVRYQIEDDGGGSVDEFKTALQMIKNTGYGLKITGYCASACTMAFSSQYNLDICITPSANLRIHKPYLARITNFGLDLVKTIPAILKSEQLYTKDFYNPWPVWLKTEVDKNGGAPSVYTGHDPSDMMVISFDILKRNLVICGD